MRETVSQPEWWIYLTSVIDDQARLAFEVV